MTSGSLIPPTKVWLVAGSSDRLSLSNFSSLLTSRTPLHCAASCNNVQVCKFLVESGAAVFATTYSDMQTAADKCEEMEEGYAQCSQFLYGETKHQAARCRGCLWIPLRVSEDFECHEGVQGNHRRSERNLKAFKELLGVFKKVNHHVALEVSQRFAKSSGGIMEPPKTSETNLENVWILLKRTSKPQLTGQHANFRRFLCNNKNVPFWKNVNIHISSHSVDNFN